MIVEKLKKKKRRRKEERWRQSHYYYCIRSRIHHPLTPAFVSFPFPFVHGAHEMIIGNALQCIAQAALCVKFKRRKSNSSFCLNLNLFLLGVKIIVALLVYRLSMLENKSKTRWKDSSSHKLIQLDRWTLKKFSSFLSFTLRHFIQYNHTRKPYNWDINSNGARIWPNQIGWKNNVITAENQDHFIYAKTVYDIVSNAPWTTIANTLRN